MVHSIQYLRFFAALAVVIVHSIHLLGGSFHQGHHGVDLFFVISGFVIYLVTERAGNAPGTFLSKRLVRVALPYWVILLLVGLDDVLLGWIHSPSDRYDASNLIHSFLFVFRTSDVGDFDLPSYTIGWTLNYEIFFYALFAAAMAISHGYRLIVAAGSILALAVLQWFVRFEGGFWYMIQTRTAIEFVYGMVAAHVYLRHRATVARHRATVPAALAAIAVSLVLLAIGPPVSAYSGTRFVTAGLPAALLVCGLLALDACDRLPRSRLLFYLGGASYSLYLVHLFVVVYVVRIVPPEDWPNRGIAVVAMVAASLVASVAFHHLCERPLMDLSRRLGGRRPPSATRPPVRQA